MKNLYLLLILLDLYRKSFEDDSDILCAFESKKKLKFLCFLRGLFLFWNGKLI